VYSQRVLPNIDQGLKDKGIGGQRLQRSRFLPSIAWLDPDQVAGKLNAQRAGGGQGASSAPAPGLHGHGLTGVTSGDTTLQPSPAVNRIAAGANPTFTVQYANQGENDETEVRVTIRIRGSGNPIVVRKTINQTKAGQPGEVQIPLGRAAPLGQPVTIEASIDGVPGEKKTDNNKQSYTAIFSR
jgi:hypothetical protein